MYYLIAALYILVCVLLQLTVLLQQGKGGDIASAFGGGSSQAAFGARAGATVLTKITAGAAVLFMVCALTLSILGQRGPGSVVGGTRAPVPPAQTKPAAPPAAPAGQSAPATPSGQSAPAPAPSTPATPPR